VKQTTQDSLWTGRINGANSYYDKWANKFKCDTLEKYYEGFQWRSQRDLEYRPYVINNVFEIVQLKIDQNIPPDPKFKVHPVPGNADFDFETASLSAQLKEDVLNSITANQRIQFQEELELAYKDSFFRFGIIEVGYSADWVENPHVQAPLTNKDTDPDAGKPRARKPLTEIPVNERIYVRHIPAKRFRVGGFDHKYLDHCTWCGYYEFVDKNDFLALPGLMNRDKIDRAAESVPDGIITDREDGRYKSGVTIKIWHIWDNKAKQRLILLDSPKTTVFQRSFKRLPLFDFRHDRRVSDESFYPVPPVWHWLSPQDEINETREQIRAHRRRFVRKFQVRDGMVDDEEIEKFENGQDGALIKVKADNAIQPIQNADLGAALNQAIVTSADDLNRISGTSSEQRGVADRTTATQANIINQRSTIRESASTARINNWMSNIGREILLTVKDKFTLGVYAQVTSDPGEQLFQTIQQNNKIYQWVSTEDLDDGNDFRIKIDETSLSAAVLQQEEQSFFKFLAVVTQFPAISMSPKLIREAAYRVGYRNEAVIREMQQMAQLHQLGVMNGVMQAQNPGNQIAQAQVAQQTPNSLEEVRNQLVTQLRPQ